MSPNHLMTFFSFYVFHTFGLNSVQSEDTINAKLCGDISLEKNDGKSNLCQCTRRKPPQLEEIWTIRVDCSSKGFTSKTFDPEILPIFIENLDLSWNQLDEVPDIVSETLHRLFLAHNKITLTTEKNFIHVPNLIELDLSWNGLELLSINSFAELQHLQKLDLSGNNMKKINFNMFSPLVSLEILDLSSNPKLNESSDIRELDFFLAYGITPKLKTLKMDRCNLNEIHLNHAVNLQELHLNWNNLTQLTDIGRNLKFIDFSGNPIEAFGADLLPHLLELEVLLLEDMPHLTIIDEYALFGLPNLKVLSFQNSRLLNSFHPHAFGENLTTGPHRALERVNLRGTALKRLNSTLVIPFEHVTIFDLTGLNLICDCNLQWIRGLNVETGGRCNDPINLQGKKISELLDSQFECNTTPTWVSQLFNGLLILLLLVLCSVGIWLIVLGLKPSHKKDTGHKVGASSPYARITIEPNQVENYC